MTNNPGLAIINILIKYNGPGDAALAASWADKFNLENVLVWGDTTNYSIIRFGNQLASGGSISFPYSMVIDIDTMELRALRGGGIMSSRSDIDKILNASHPCATY